MNRSSAALRFTELLLSLVGGNASLIDALSVLSRDGMEPPIRETASALLLLMKKGVGFSDALAMLAPGKIRFAPLYITLLGASEMTGSIVAALEKIVLDLRRGRQSRETLTGVMVYPALIILAALAGTIVLVAKGIPLFVRAGMLSGAFLDTAFWGIVFAGVFLFVSEGLLLCIYFRIFGRDSPEYRIFYLLSLLLENHITLGDALTQCIVTVGETKYGRALLAVKNDVASGVRFSRAFAKSALFSPYVSGWLSIADANGNIGEACRNIALYFEKRDERVRNVAARCMEPAVIIITGIYLLILVQTVILPVLTHAGGMV
ncbi:MAG: type II secretion system F family protein [Treponema sp.]|jgi:type IV pilus assembly protein PilC|nr:type II secretion system F family protein [Treponema sp.]